MSELRSNEAEWAKLAEAATPGPWEVESEQVSETSYTHARVTACVSVDYWSAECDEVVLAQGSPADAEFIAAAREAVPALLAEVIRLRTELAASRDETERMANRWIEACGAIEQARGEVSQLRAKIEGSTVEARVMHRSPNSVEDAKWSAVLDLESVKKLADEARAEGVWGEVWIETRTVTPWTRAALAAPLGETPGGD